MDDFHPLELDSLLHAFPSLKLITFHQTRVIGVYNECKKYVVNTIIMMVIPPAKLVFRFRLSFIQKLSPGLQLTPGFSISPNIHPLNSLVCTGYNWPFATYMHCFFPMTYINRQLGSEHFYKQYDTFRICLPPPPSTT